MQLKTSEGTHCIQIEHCTVSKTARSNLIYYQVLKLEVCMSRQNFQLISFSHVLIWKTKQVAMFWGEKGEYIYYIFLMSNKIVS